MREVQELDALRLRVEQLERSSADELRDLIDAIDARVKAIESRPKPGRKPKAAE
jgi:hypothetical protein